MLGRRPAGHGRSGSPARLAVAVPGGGHAHSPHGHLSGHRAGQQPIKGEWQQDDVVVVSISIASGWHGSLTGKYDAWTDLGLTGVRLSARRIS